MKMKVVAGLAFLLNTLLFATYYSVAKEALKRIDPIVFTFLVMIALIPVALCILVLNRRHITKEVVKSGALLGSCLCLGLFTLAVALKYNSATSTAFFPSLNGLLAAAYAWLFLRQPIGKITWFSGGVSFAGAVLLIANLGMGGVRGSLIAFIGGLFCTLYVFLADHEQRNKPYWPLFGVELLTMALWANLIALLFGNWQAVHPVLFKDVWIVLYISFGTTLLPTLITVLLQRYIKPVTVSFIYILEPVLGAVVAYLYLHETLPIYGYIGGVMIVVGTAINTWGTAQQPVQAPALRRRLARANAYLQNSLFGSLAYPLLCCGLGVVIVYRLGGFPPSAWLTLYRLGTQLPVYMQVQPSGVLLLIAQSFSWLVAWVSLGVMAVLTTYRLLGRTQVPSRALVSTQKVVRPRQIAAYAYPAAQRARLSQALPQHRQVQTNFVELRHE